MSTGFEEDSKEEGTEGGVAWIQWWGKLIKELGGTDTASLHCSFGQLVVTLALEHSHC